VTDSKHDITTDLSLLGIFRSEVITQTAIIQEGVLALQNQSQSRQTLENMMRAAHSIQGAATIVEIDPVVTLAGFLEDYFIGAAKQNINLEPNQIDLLQQAVNWLQNLSQTVDEDLDNWLSQHLDEVNRIIQGIRAWGTGHGAMGAEELLSQRRTLVSKVEATGVSGGDSLSPEGKGEVSLGTSSDSQPKSPTVTQSVSSGEPQVVSPSVVEIKDTSMLDLFRLEVEAQGAILNEGLLSLESQPQSAQALESLMRAAHSVKGAARIVGIDAAVQLAHVMEDCFVAAQNHAVTLDGDDVDVLLSGVDLLINISQLEPTDLNPWLSQHVGEIAATKEAVTAIFTPGAVAKVKVQRPQEQVNSAPPDKPKLDVTAGSEKSLATTANELATTTSSQLEPINQSTTSQLTPATDRVVRVSAENLNRIMGLAGESLIEANWLQPFADSLIVLKRRQLELAKILEDLQNSSSSNQPAQSSEKDLEKARQKERECREILGDRLNELELFARRNTTLSDRLYREVIASNMRPFTDGVQGFPRMIRDLARKLGKQVKLEILGKSTPVDRDILKKLEAPLTHILRNAVDHGIELPPERLAAGKPEEGTLKLEAFHRGGMLAITISDDGKGINPEWLRQKVVSKNLTNAEMAAQLSDSELMEFLFLPGFSTAKQVTEISGRGVGLDIAKTMAQEVGGNVRVSSQPGMGTTFNFQLPLTLSVVRTLLVEISGEPYAFPLARIDQIVIVNKKEISSVENRQYFTLDNKNIGLVAAHQVLELQEFPSNSDTLSVVVISEQSDYYGLVVDRFLGEHDLVVRPLDPRLGKVQDMSAAALMGDGSLILIVDVSDIMRSIDNLLNNRRLAHFSNDAGIAVLDSRKSILVVDDSITVREMERRLLENKGYQVDVAVNGMEGWHAVCAKNYDLVISDVDMPRMNGIEFVSKIKNDPRLNSIPVIIVSYKDSEEHRVQGLTAGADYYLTKASFHDETLVNAVIDLIGA
jgi:two-component system sensor histidine kinase and response regulator WspE